MRYIATDDKDYLDHGCCHEAVVVDTETPTMIGNTVYKKGTTVCECYTLLNAVAIADALNRAEFDFAGSKE